MRSEATRVAMTSQRHLCHRNVPTVTRQWKVDLNMAAVLVGVISISYYLYRSYITPWLLKVSLITEYWLISVIKLDGI